MKDFYKSLKRWLLLKAINLHKDRSKLVLVERMVTKRGKTFRQRFWVSPDGVKKTDKVLLHHHNLPDGHEQKPKNVASPTANIKYSDDVKKVTNEYFDKFSDRVDLYAALKSQGIYWKDTKDDAIQWMRAKKAVNAAVHNGYKLVDFDKISTPADNSAQDNKPNTLMYSDLIDTSKMNESFKDLKTLKRVYNSSAGIGNSKFSLPAEDSPQWGKGIISTTTTPREDKLFSAALSNATPKNRHIYRSLGIVGKNEGANKYLEKLFIEKSKVLDEEDNLSISTSEVLSRISKTLGEDFGDTTYIKNFVFGVCCLQSTLLKENLGLETRVIEGIQYNPNVTGGIEKQGDFTMFRKRLELLKRSPDHTELVTEFSQKFEELTALFDQDPEILSALIDEVGEKDDYDVTRRMVRNRPNTRIKLLNLYKTVKTWSQKTAQTQNYYEEKLTSIKRIDKQSLEKALKLREELYDKKYYPILQNWLIFQSVAKEMVKTNKIATQNLAETFPVFSDSEIQKLQIGITGTSFYKAVPGMNVKVGTRDTLKFIPILLQYTSNKPLNTLSQAYNDAIDNINSQYNVIGEQEGDVERLFTDNVSIKSSLEEVSPTEFKTLQQKLFSDWDKKTHGSKSRLTIKGIYKVSDLEMEKDFEEFKQKHAQYANVTSGGKNCQVDEFYHGTDYAATVGILGTTGHFLPSSSGMFGKGEYLAAHSSKSAQYAGNGYSHGKRRGTLFIVEASLGNTKTMSAGESQDTYNTVDTVHGGLRSVVNHEWCTHNDKAVKPVYLCDIEVSK